MDDSNRCQQSGQQLVKTHSHSNMPFKNGQAKGLFTAIFQGKQGCLEIRVLNQGRASQRFFPIQGGIEDAARNTATMNGDVVFGVLPRIRESGKNEDIVDVSTLWADLDQGVRPWQEFPLAPTAVVASGTPGHSHCYWVLAEPLSTKVGSTYLKALAVALKADLQACDLARCLRVPATTNTKGPYTCELQVVDANRRYSIKEIRHAITIVLLSPFWVEGQRQSLALSLAGFLAKGGVTQEEAEELLGSVTAHLGDEETKGRLRAVFDTYNKLKENKEVQGYRGLQELMRQAELNTLEGLWSIRPTGEAAKTGTSQEPRSKSPSQADEMAMVSLASAIEFFHDQHMEPYVCFPKDGRQQVWPLRSKSGKRWLAHLYWQTKNKIPNSDAIQAALNVLEGEACFRGTRHDLHVRTALHEGAIYYDLGDWRAVRISTKGWEVVDTPPILFRHFAHQQPQPEPKHGGRLDDVLKYVNLPGDSQKWQANQQQHLFLVYLVAGLVPDIPHPLMVVYGEQGTGKTCIHRIAKALLDPSSIRIQGNPKDLNEFIQLASHHLCLYLDNLSSISDGLSDAMCRLSTGEGFSKRMLYTDDDDVVYSFKGLGGFNGINLVAGRPDLLDRSIIFSLAQIQPENRVTEKAFWGTFLNTKPLLLGAMLDILSGAMAIFPEIHPATLPRMADFALWGCAIARAMGSTEKQFLTYYEGNIRNQDFSALEASPVAQTVLNFLDGKRSWAGAPHELLSMLEMEAEKLKVNTRSKGWPKAPHILTRRLKEVLPNLRRLGVIVGLGEEERAAGRRRITISREGASSVTSDSSGTAASKSAAETKSSGTIPAAVASCSVTEKVPGSYGDNAGAANDATSAILTDDDGDFVEI